MHLQLLCRFLWNVLDMFIHEDCALLCRYFLHWLVVNLPGVDVNRGEVVTPYMGPVRLLFH